MNQKDRFQFSKIFSHFLATISITKRIKSKDISLLFILADPKFLPLPLPLLAVLHV